MTSEAKGTLAHEAKGDGRSAVGSWHDGRRVPLAHPSAHQSADTLPMCVLLCASLFGLLACLTARSTTRLRASPVPTCLSFCVLLWQAQDAV